MAAEANCGYCHSCGMKLQIVLDGEEWCSECQQYRRYRSHGWASSENSPCLTTAEIDRHNALPVQHSASKRMWK